MRERTSDKNDKAFLNEVVNRHSLSDGIPSDFLESEVIPWIDENIPYEQVHEIDGLREWAQEQNVEDVCTIKNLEAWAEANGYTKVNEA